MERPVSTTIGREPTPIESACCMSVGEVERPLEEIGDRAQREQRVVLDGLDLLFGDFCRRDQFQFHTLQPALMGAEPHGNIADGVGLADGVTVSRSTRPES